MGKMIRVPCPDCAGEWLKTLPDGRGTVCPTCSCCGFVLKELADMIQGAAEVIADKMLSDNKQVENKE